MSCSNCINAVEDSHFKCNEELVEKLISLINKSQAREETLELENQKLKAKIKQLKSQGKD